MKMHNNFCNDVCQLGNIEVTWESHGVQVSKVMVNNCAASAFVDKLHSESENYSVKFL